MKPTKEQLIKIYQKAGKKAEINRELLFLDLQELGDIPADIEYSDEAYAELVGEPFAALPSQEVANQYLINVYNKLALIDFRRISGERNELFNRALQSYVPYGDTVELIYTDIQDVGGYDVTKFIPDATKGGDKVLSQRIQLDNDPTPANPDRRLLDVVVPTLLISQALNGAITTGLANGWPTIFDEQMRRSWDIFKFERQRNLLALTGGTPNSNMWFKPTTTFTPNEPSFIQITTPIKDTDTFNAFLVQLYGISADLRGQYSNAYNPAKIKQISPLDLQGIFFDSSLEAYWRNTNAIVYNSEIIDVKNVYNSVDFVKLLPSKVKPEAINVKAILYVDYPYLHYPFTDGVYRGMQMFERNRTTAIYDHFWLASGIDLSKNVIVLYEAGEPEPVQLNTVVTTTSLTGLTQPVDASKLETAVKAANTNYQTGNADYSDITTSSATMTGKNLYTGTVNLTYTAEDTEE